jgi:hypothetical protein
LLLDHLTNEPRLLQIVLDIAAVGAAIFTSAAAVATAASVFFLRRTIKEMNSQRTVMDKQLEEMKHQRTVMNSQLSEMEKQREEMQTQRLHSVRPRLIVTVAECIYRGELRHDGEDLEDGLMFLVEFSNVGLGPAIDVRITSTFPKYVILIDESLREIYPGTGKNAQFIVPGTRDTLILQDRKITAHFEDLYETHRVCAIVLSQTDPPQLARDVTMRVPFDKAPD